MLGMPLFRDQKKVDDFILTYKPNPFPAPPASTDFLENPAKFIIGRDRELKLIESAIRESLGHLESKLMFLQGKQGIGKSTIISSIPRYLSEHDLGDKVLIVYFNTSNDPNDFRFLNFYRQAISVLDRTEFLERLVFNTLRKIL
ncbi:MAG: ATP-binding protein, partial [Candidatus Odinarchaeota archaeon]